MKNWLSKNRQTLLRTVGSILAIGLLLLLISQQGWDKVIIAVKQIPLWRFGVALGLVFISRFFVAGRWHVLLRTGGVDIPFSRTIALTFTGLFSSNFLPSTIGGDVVRFAGAVQYGYDSSIALASLVADRLVGMAGMAMVLPIGLWPVWQFLQSGRTLGSITLVGLWGKGVNFVKRTFQSLGLWLRKPSSLLGSLGCTWGHMLCTFTAYSVLLGGLNEHLSFWLIAGLWSVQYFISLVPISINGLGVQELLLYYLFANVGGISLTASLTLAGLMRIIQTLASLPGAFYLPSILAGMDSSTKIQQ
jgi:glycosyltransferase 2 family protein